MKIIEIVPYDENWPREFAEIAGPLRATLGEVALRIDHIGSTFAAAVLLSLLIPSLLKLVPYGRGAGYDGGASPGPLPQFVAVLPSVKFSVAPF
jgi:GrpB protein